MTRPEITLGAAALVVGWPGAAPASAPARASVVSATYPHIWLRDNDPSQFHPDTHERMGDLLALPDEPLARDAGLDGDTLWIDWADGAQSRFALDWLWRHRPGNVAEDPGAVAHRAWAAGFVPARFDAGALMRSDAALRDWLSETAATGLSLVEGLEAKPGAGLRLAERIGFLRRTNFGAAFEVMNKPEPNNLAYTALALPLHTDLPNQELPPGYQFLHCIANEAPGGGSVFADGVTLAEALRARDPASFELLVQVPIPFQFHDGEADIRIHRPVITLDAKGQVDEIKWNAHLAAPFDMSPDLLPDYYRAYRQFMALTRDPAYQTRLRLGAGEMAVFDNRLILHGRDAFDASAGFRHLQGCYVDRGEVLSRLRVLSRGA